MKRFFLCMTFLLSVLFVSSQDIQLTKMSSVRYIPNGFAAIYGKFIQRIGFSSGGFSQEIRIINIETKKVYAFVVKGTYKSKKEITFSYYIQPGKYEILNYQWGKGTWYGSQIVTEPIYKDVDATDNFNQNIENGVIDSMSLKRFEFIIEENTLNYMGTWNFDNGEVVFLDEKELLDKTMKERFLKLTFENAINNLPK